MEKEAVVLYKNGSPCAVLSEGNDKQKYLDTGEYTWRILEVDPEVEVGWHVQLNLDNYEQSQGRPTWKATRCSKTDVETLGNQFFCYWGSKNIAFYLMAATEKEAIEAARTRMLVRMKQPHEYLNLDAYSDDPHPDYKPPL